MKFTKLLIIFISIPIIIFSQEKSNCIVKVPELQGEYRGDCKKGLADGTGSAQGEHIYEGEFKKGYPHGEGKYIWAGDDYYVGSFKKGKRSGFGKHYLIIEGKSSYIEGYWKNDIYLGKEKKVQNYSSVRKTGIDRVSYIYKGSGDGTNEIMIRFKRAGAGSRSQVYSPSINASSGDLIDQGERYGFENVEFPFSASMSFNVPNKANTMLILATLTFEIMKEGSWDVIIYF
ncbi:MAG: hypothetical protein K9J13_17025 [Saprospiraceae bacterium]|nr:hypothetical protein [Saprospiraceae bacterium]